MDSERDKAKARVTAVVGVSELLDIDRSIVLKDVDADGREVPIGSFGAPAVIAEAAADYADIDGSMEVE